MIIRPYRDYSEDIQEGDDPHEVKFWADESSERLWFLHYIFQYEVPHLRDVMPFRIVLRQEITVAWVEEAIASAIQESPQETVKFPPLQRTFGGRPIDDIAPNEYL